MNKAGRNSYNQPKYLVELVGRGIGVVVRYNPQGMNVYDSEQRKIDLYDSLMDTPENSRCISVRIRKENDYIEGYIHAIRLPPEQTEQARRRLRANAKKEGYTPSDRALFLAGWVLIFSSIPPVVLPTDTIAALYRVRWQVELVIKRMKSVLDINKLRAREESALANLYLHGKLLYTWILEKRARQRCGEDWNRLDRPRTATPWRVWKFLRQELTVAINGVSHWDLNRWQDCLHVLQERPRRRKLQTLPTEICRIIDFCQANGLSNI